MSLVSIEDFDVKEYIRELCRSGSESTSKEIAAFLVKKGHFITWQSVAATISAFNRSSK